MPSTASERRGLPVTVDIFKYERMPIFCYWCGVMNHNELSDVGKQSRIFEGGGSAVWGLVTGYLRMFQATHFVKNRSTQSPNTVAA